MITSAYVADSSGWIFLTSPTLTLGIASDDRSPLLAELWMLVDTGGGASAVLDALTRGGISSAPDFAIVAPGADGKVIVRGSATVIVDGSEHATLSGRGFSSWAERTIEQIDRFSCEITPTADSARMPLVSGAVRAGWFGVDLSGVDVFGSTSEVSGTHSSVPVAIPVPVEPPAPTSTPASTSTPAPVATPVEIPVPSPPPPAKSAESVPSEVTVIAVDEAEEDEEAPAPASLISPPSDGTADGKATPYDFLFGDTSYRTVEEAAVRPAAIDDTDDKAVEDRTVVASDLAQLRAKRRAARGRSSDTPPAPTFLVELSTGGRELLDQPLVIGRAPSAAALGGNRLPRLVTMTTPNQDISRTHAQISVEGGTVVVTDLHSSNGTIVILPGRPAQKLREGEATPVIPGTVIDLGDGATLTVREN